MSLFGSNIKKIRSVKKMTQVELAKKIAVTRGSISSYEEGRAEPKIDTLIKTAREFSISIDDLLTKKITVNQITKFNSHIIKQTNEEFIKEPSLEERLMNLENRISDLENK